MEYWKMILIALGAAAITGTAVYTGLHYGYNRHGLQAYNPKIVAAYKEWQVKFNKKESDPDQEAYRLGVFADNFNMIENHNTKKEATYTLGQNQFMDLTHSEFKTTYLGLQQKTKPSPYGTHKHSGKKAASTVDWTKKGDVSAIKNQGQCGSCWAFSTTGSLESDDAIFGKALGDFSEQQLVDCSSKYGNMGCNGGLMDQAFEYIIDGNPITTEDNYPYKAVTGTCDSSKIKEPTFSISKYTDVASGNCDDLQDAVQQQPISIGVDAETWQFYSGGVFSDCGTQLDHGVLNTGYDSDGNHLVKNSWGSSWGNNGYITLKSGNTCGICNTASYPSI